MEKQSQLRSQKQSLAQLLQYYVDKMYGHIYKEDDNIPSLSWKQSLAVLDRIVSIMEV